MVTKEFDVDLILQAGRLDGEFDLKQFFHRNELKHSAIEFHQINMRR